MALHGCPSCGGIWLGTECAQRFSLELPQEALAIAAKHRAMASDKVDTAPPVQCPVCGTTMQRTHATAAALDLDFCGTHGTWYDHDELERIATAIGKTRWKQEDVKLVDAPRPSGASLSTSGNGASDVVDTIATGVGVAVELIDVADVGSSVAEGVVDFFSSIFD